MRVHPDTADYLETQRSDALERLRAMSGGKITIQAVPSYHREQYDVTLK